MATDTSLDVKKATKEKKEKKRKRDKDVEGVAQSKDESAKKHKKSKTVNGASGPSQLLAEKNSKESKPTDNHVGKTSETSLRHNSPFIQRTLSFYVTLSPCAHNFPLEGICAEHISPLLLTYYPPLEGVLLSYTNARLSDRPETNAHPDQVYARGVDEYAVTFTWLTADFVLFQPKRGSHLEGHVNLQNESLLGLMCYNYFNAVIERDQLPSDWRWNAGGDDTKTHNAVESGNGHFVDESGKKVEGRIVFRVRDFDAIPGADANSGGTIHIYGTLLPSDGPVASGSA